MNEELDSQLSAMFDDELPEGECELLARRLSRDPLLQERWARYAAIGAAVRGEVRASGRLARQVSVVIAGETSLVHVAVQAASSRTRFALSRTWRAIAGGALAASVATLSILYLHGAGTAGSVPAPALAAVIPTTASAAVEAPASYVVPRATEARMIVPATELAKYVVAHSEYSTPVNRSNLLSALMASEQAATGVPEQPALSGNDPHPHAEQAR
jgi:negative regulator of sigma E activity